MMNNNKTLIVALLLACSPLALASDADSLSQKLANPVADLISVPLQGNFDYEAGPDDNGLAFTLNVQPVIPVDINDKWRVITRTIVPIAYHDYIPSGDVSGLGDITASFFLSPKSDDTDGLIWGAGPVFLLPTATDELLGAEQFGAGPTAVALKQQGPWTVGALANHIWSVAGDHNRDDVSTSLLQPFVTYNFGHGTSVALSVDSTYNWEAEQWNVPVNLNVSQVIKVGKQALSLQLGGRYFAETPEGGPDWGVRTAVTFLFPK